MIGSGSPIVMELIKTLVVRATRDSVPGDTAMPGPATGRPRTEQDFRH
jgi:hypothetical protein